MVEIRKVGELNGSGLSSADVEMAIVSEPRSRFRSVSIAPLDNCRRSRVRSVIS